MNKSETLRLVIVALCICLFSANAYSQGDNNPDPLVNLGCIENATVTGSVPDSVGRGIPDDIFWDPSKNDYKTESQYHEYGMAFDDMIAATKEDPLWWQIEWPTAKNINYITVTGVYDNQPQPHTGWAIQIDSAGTWKNLAKADNGWPADTLKGIGGWVNGELMELRLIQPVVTSKLRFCAYANPDSLADGKETFSDSLWSFAWSGRQLSATSPKACLIQYIDYSEAEATNRVIDKVNLGLLDEAVVSSLYDYQEIANLRGHPTDMLWDPKTGDFNNPNTNWAEFGMPYNYEAGYLTKDDPFYWMVEWPVPKNINYFTWGGVYGSQVQPYTPWAVQYWDGSAWVAVASGVGTDRTAGTWQYNSLGEQVDFWGIGVDRYTNSTWSSETPIQTTKLRLAVWSDGSYPLWSYHIRGRGGQTKNWDERIWVNGYDPDGWIVTENGADPIPSTFKAMLVQYRDLSTAIEADRKVDTPTEFALQQNYPNPFNPVTVINWQLAVGSQVELNVYNLVGQKVATLISERQSAGSYLVEWDASNFASGIYFYRLQTDGGFVQTRKLMLIK